MFHKLMIATRTLYILVTTTLLCGLCITSCQIYDDLSGCPPEQGGLSLHYAYHPNGQKQDAFAHKIGHTTLLLYTSAGKFVGSYPGKHTGLSAYQGAHIGALPDGTYTAIAMGNDYSGTRLVDMPDITKAAFGPHNAFTQGDVSGTDSLYFARRELTVKEGYLQPDTLYFRSAHIKMHLLLKGFGEEASSGKPSPLLFRHTHLPLYTDLSGVPSATQHMTYRLDAPQPYPTQGLYRLDYNTLTFSATTESAIELFDATSGKLRYTLPIAHYIATGNLFIDDRDEVEIFILFTISGTSVTVQPWDKEPLNPVVE